MTTTLAHVETEAPPRDEIAGQAIKLTKEVRGDFGVALEGNGFGSPSFRAASGRVEQALRTVYYVALNEGARGQNKLMWSIVGVVAVVACAIGKWVL